MHPDHPERGNRNYELEAPRTVFLSAEDSKLFSDSKKIRLKDLCNLEYGLPAKYTGNDVSVLKHGVRAVQWVGADAVNAKLIMPDGSVMNGLIEKSVESEKCDTIQLERIGFARIESRDSDGIGMVFTHR